VNAPAYIKKAALLFAARVLNDGAARCFKAATAEERRRWEARQAEAERIVADGEAALAEYINGRAMLAHLEEELAISGGTLPRRLRWELNLYLKLRSETALAIENADPETVQAAVTAVLALARLASRQD
jgi:hypothetical protein